MYSDKREEKRQVLRRDKEVERLDDKKHGLMVDLAIVRGTKTSRISRERRGRRTRQRSVESKLGYVSDLISKALDDNTVSIDEYFLIL